LGDPELSGADELALRRTLLERALRALETRVDQQTIFD
jgi:glycine reductase